MYLGTSAIAAGSTMVFSRSIETWPRVSERMSRIVASVTKPSVTSTLPSGAFRRFCSVSAMFSWSELMMPLCSRVCPSGTWASGVAWIVPMTLRLQLREAALRRGRIELRGLAPGSVERAPVVLRGEPRLAEVVEAHGEVEDDVGVGGIEAVRLEVLDLRVVPARLRRVQVAERRMQLRALRVARDLAAQLRLEAFGLRVVGERGEARDRGAVARIEVERAPVVARGEHAVSGTRLDGGRAEERVEVGGIGGERRGVALPRRREVAVAKALVGRRDLGGHARGLRRRREPEGRRRGGRRRVAQEVRHQLPRLPRDRGGVRLLHFPDGRRLDRRPRPLPGRARARRARPAWRASPAPRASAHPAAGSRRALRGRRHHRLRGEARRTGGERLVLEALQAVLEARQGRARVAEELLVGQEAAIVREVAFHARVADHHRADEDHQLDLLRLVVAVAHQVAEHRDAGSHRQAVALALEAVEHEAAEDRGLAARDLHHAFHLARLGHRDEARHPGRGERVVWLMYAYY